MRVCFGRGWAACVLFSMNFLIEVGCIRWSSMLGGGDELR